MIHLNDGSTMQWRNPLHPAPARRDALVEVSEFDGLSDEWPIASAKLSRPALSTHYQNIGHDTSIAEIKELGKFLHDCSEEEYHMVILMNCNWANSIEHHTVPILDAIRLVRSGSVELFKADVRDEFGDWDRQSVQLARHYKVPSDGWLDILVHVPRSGEIVIKKQ